jgi:hypothetical protein
MKQGVLWTGVMKARLQADIFISHEGRQFLVKDVDLFVWESGRDITWSKTFMQDHKLADLRGFQGDDDAIASYATVTPEDPDPEYVF